MQTQHFLITRFNLRTYSPEIVTNNDADLAIKDEWLSHRFQLFEQYCFPSVKGQTNQNFQWLVFFDAKTPDKYLLKIEALKKEFTLFQPIFLSPTSDFNSALVETIKEKGNISEKIITTRLDNDDAIHESFISKLQIIASTLNKSLIDVRNGYQVTIKQNQYEIRRYFPPFNHFLSIVEPYGDFKTVFERIHPAWDCPEVPCYIFTQQPLWIEFIHGKNNLCHTRNYLKRICKIKQNEFGITAQISDTWLKVFASNILKYSLGIINRITTR